MSATQGSQTAGKAYFVPNQKQGGKKKVGEAKTTEEIRVTEAELTKRYGRNWWSEKMTRK